jgi:hypothetical protein
MNLKKLVIRPSAGEPTAAQPNPPPIDAGFTNYCSALETAMPTLVPASGAARLDLVQLHMAINLKVALVTNNAFKVALEQPWQHEVDEHQPDRWIRTWPIALMFAVTFDVGGTRTKQYFSISFGDDVHVPDP